jgi:hypothetical protein
MPPAPKTAVSRRALLTTGTAAAVAPARVWAPEAVATRR